MSEATSSKDYSVEIATPADDTAILRLLASNPTPGRVALSFERAPSYFLSCRPMGRLATVGIVRHGPSGEVAALGVRAIRQRWVNGRIEDVGYLTDLVVDRRFRGRWLVPRLFQLARADDANHPTVGNLTIIAEENVQSLGVLVHRARKNIPAYRSLATLCTLAVPILWRRTLPRSPFVLRRATAEDVPGVVSFLRAHGAQKQFFPVYTEADFLPGAPLTLGFRLDNLLVARMRGEIVGITGLWDRSATKQAVVRGYGGPVRWARPGYNAIAQIIGAPRLPDLGQPLPLAYASFVCVADNDARIFEVLLRHLFNLAAERRYGYVVVDLADTDPLLKVARRFVHFAYRRRLYSVAFKGGPDLQGHLDGRIPYVETAAL